MVDIEIYYNKNGELTLKGRENDALQGCWSGSKAKRIIDGIKNEKIENVYIDERNTCIVAYNDACVRIKNVLNKKDEPYLQEYFDVIADTVKSQNEERAGKVSRTNKHRGTIALATTVLVAAIAFSILIGAKNSVNATDLQQATDKETKIAETIEKHSQSIEQIITSIPQFETAPPITEEYKDEYAIINYSDRSYSEKLETARALYGDIINKYATTYGLDPELVLALATQERGIHSSKKDPGGATGLMQIQNSVWVGSDLTAYNFNTESYEKIKVTKEKIEDCETNIKIGCMILQDMIRAKDYNIVAGLLSYNMGGYSVDKILAQYQNVSGLARKEVLNNQNDCGWLEYRDIIKIGDRDYVQHVLSYMGNDIDTYVIKPSGERVEVSIKNYDASKTVSR